ncbi:L-asparaginase 1 [Gracilariopsis chorda]|uniref:asparaginase n=1 Tax=Gracilariopsis chorda TaxID=448386 RepID=A0A2V3IQJ2_9FLOR|nr:L-asparaginase 1 [Gracilariopsis chorda]|eukprot:PXF44349.1 L-asparaginase 1 [Gracilariopsis chorda]
MPSAFVTITFRPLFAKSTTKTSTNSRHRVTHLAPRCNVKRPSSESNGAANDASHSEHVQPSPLHESQTPGNSISASNIPPNKQGEAVSDFLDLSSTPGVTQLNAASWHPSDDSFASLNNHLGPSPNPSSTRARKNPTQNNPSGRLPDSGPKHVSSQFLINEQAIPDAVLPHNNTNRAPYSTESPLPHVLIIHCGGTFGMQLSNTSKSKTLKPAVLLQNLLVAYPELNEIANLNVSSPMNLDSSRMGPDHWIKIAKLLDKHRDTYDGFVIIHGTDTMAYTGAALSLMLAGFRKPVVLTGSQRPMLMPRSDARQNLVDAVTVACQSKLQEFAVCFGGLLLRANRALKYSSSAYRAFSSPTHPPLAILGVDIEWNQFALWKDPGVYRPRMKLDPNVIRIPVVPGANPKQAYGDLVARGVRGAVIESFGVGNVPDHRSAGWMGWLRSQQKLGLKIYLSTQCATGPLNPNLYNSSAAGALGATSTKRMTTETAVVKMMLCLAHPDLHLSYPLAGEL